MTQCFPYAYKTSLQWCRAIGADVDLGISWRKAIICVSTKGLARACAEALAEAGGVIVLNRRGGDGLGAFRRRAGVREEKAVS